MGINNINPTNGNSGADKPKKTNHQPTTNASEASIEQETIEHREVIQKISRPDTSVGETESHSRTDDELIKLIGEDRLWALKNPNRSRARYIAREIKEPIEEERKVARENSKTLYARYIAKNIKEPSEEERKVARENPDTLYARYIARNITEPSEEERKVAMQNPNTFYARSIAENIKEPSEEEIGLSPPGVKSQQ